MKNHEEVDTAVLDRADAPEGQTLRELTGLGGRLKANLENIGSKISNGSDAFMEKSRDTWRSTESTLSKNPWWTLGLSAGIGFLAGMIITRRRH